MRLSKRVATGITTASFTLGALVAYAPSARADEIQGTPKAIVGGALLGAEVVTIPMGLAGVKAGWAYALFPGLGAVGGGIGGFFMDQAYDSSGTNAYGSAFMLAGGMILLIPAIVVMLNATRYHPEAGATEDHAPTNAPEANPGTPGGSVVQGGGSAATGTGGASTTGGATTGGATTGGDTGGGTPAPAPAPTTGGGGGGAPPYIPLSLFDVHEGTFRLGVPVPEVHFDYTLRQAKEFGVVRTPELRLPVVRVAF